MKNKELVLLSLDRCYKNSITSKFIDWLIKNEDCEFTIEQLREELETTPRAVSGAFRNAKVHYGFVFESVRIEGWGNRFIHRLVDCKYKPQKEKRKPKSKGNADLWKSALSI